MSKIVIRNNIKAPLNFFSCGDLLGGITQQVFYGQNQANF